MVTVNRVMVGVDFSKDSDASLAAALQIAALHGAEVYAVHVIDSRPEDNLLNPAVEHQKTILDALNARLIRVADKAVPSFDKRGLHSLLRTGRPAEELISAADEKNADVVVVGNRGRGLIQRTLLGSVASSLVRRLKRPLIVTRGWEQGPEKRVLAAVDLGDDSVRVIRVAADWAKRIGAPLDVLYAWEIAGLSDSYSAIAGLPGRDVDRTAIHDARVRIAQLVEEVLGPDNDATLHVRAGLAVYEILGAIDRHEYGLAVLGSHGRRGLSKMLLGNTAEQVVERASCSILVLRVD